MKRQSQNIASRNYFGLNAPSQTTYNTVVNNKKMIRAVNLGVKYGLVVAHILLVYFLALLFLGQNTILFHGIGKIFVLVAAMFHAFSRFKENRHRIKFFSSLKLGFTTAIVAALTLISMSFVFHYFFNLKLAPEVLLSFNVHPFVLYPIMGMEMIAYGLVSCLACTSYFKRPLTEKLTPANSDPYLDNVRVS